MKVKIGVKDNIEAIYKEIEQDISNKQINLSKEEEGEIKYLILKRERFYPKKEYLAKTSKLVMDIIFKVYFSEKLKNKIYQQRPDIKNLEKTEVVRLSQALLLDKNNFFLEKEELYYKIKNYLIQNPVIYIDGFIQFQMKEADLFLNMIIDRGLEELVLEKEYKEFIKILQYFVESQEPKFDYINIIFTDKDYILLDQEDNIFDKDYFSEIVAEIEPNGISKEDLLIATLIVLAPQKVFIHLDESQVNKDVVEIIASVFQDQVYFCFGCPKCSGEGRIKKEGR